MFFQNFFNRPEVRHSYNFEAEACPNCWGFSQWENRDCPENFHIDKGSQREINSRNGFIRRFMKKYLG